MTCWLRYRRLIFAGLVLLASIVSPDQPSRAASGRDLFHAPPAEGVKAVVGQADLPLPPSLLGCARCHGRDARGASEGGAFAPAIDAETLTRETPVRRAYDAMTFGRAVREGVDSNGRRLSPAMPRYRIDDGVAEDLLAYLRGIGNEQRRGVTGEKVRLGVIASMATKSAAKDLIQSFEAEWRALASGTVHGRTLEFEFLVTETADVLMLARELETAAILAIVFPFGPTASNIVEAARLARIPVLFPLAPLTGLENPADVRGLQAHRLAQAAALLAAATPAAVVAMDSDWQKLLAGSPLLGSRDVVSVEQLSYVKDEVILFAMTKSVAELENLSRPRGPVFALVDDVAAWLRDDASNPPRMPLADPRFSPYADVKPLRTRFANAAARVAMAVIERAGRDLSRPRLMDAFRGLVAEPANWPRLDYGRHALTGTIEVHLVRIDRKPALP